MGSTLLFLLFWGIVPGTGGDQNFDVLPFSQGKKETRKQTSRKFQGSAGTVPGQSREIVVDVILLVVFPQKSI